jgi:hypothetical protein
MCNAPYVPSELELEISKLARSMNRGYINVISAVDRLAICVRVRFYLVTGWKVHTWGLGVEEKVAELQSMARRAPWKLGREWLMYEWNGETMKKVPMRADPVAIAAALEHMDKEVA